MTFLGMAGNCTAVLLQRGAASGTDAHGVVTYPAPAQVPLPGALFAPAGSTELAQGQDIVTSGAVLYAPPGSPLPAAVDQISVDGAVYAVIADTDVWTDPSTGTLTGYVIHIQKVTG